MNAVEAAAKNGKAEELHNQLVELANAQNKSKDARHFYSCHVHASHGFRSKSKGDFKMSIWRPDPTFYPSPKMAMEAPAEKLAFVAMVNGKNNGRHDALGVVDVDPASSGYGNIVGQVDMPNAGDELHHFGWNACSACLCPHAAASPCGTPLPGGAGHQFVAHPYHRYQARSAQTANREGD